MANKVRDSLTEADRRIQEQAEDPDVLFAVVVEQTIGSVRRGDGQYDGPVHAAFGIIGKHHQDAHQPWMAPATYSFPAADEGTRFVVHVSVDGIQ